MHNFKMICMSVKELIENLVDKSEKLETVNFSDAKQPCLPAPIDENLGDHASDLI